MLYQMLTAEAFAGPCAQRTQQVWRPNLGRQTCCECPGQARTFAMACAHENHLCTVICARVLIYTLLETDNRTELLL